MKRMTPEEVFEYLDEQWKWIAMDMCGLWCGYTKQPELGVRGWFVEEYSLLSIGIAIDFDGRWEESLFERPKPKVVFWKTPQSIVISATGLIHMDWDDPYPEPAPPEVAAWFHKIVEDSDE